RTLPKPFALGGPTPASRRAVLPITQVSISFPSPGSRLISSCTNMTSINADPVQFPAFRRICNACRGIWWLRPQRRRHGAVCELMTDTQVWPTELRLHKDRKTLTITYDGGERFDLPAEYLRVKSPSAGVQGHSPEERKTVPGKRNV